MRLLDRPASGRRIPIVEASGSVASLVRFSALGGSVTLPLAGIASGAGGASVAAVVLAGVLGVGFHVFAYVLNDVVDLPIDRTDPRRARSPLVGGIVTPGAALALAGAMLIAAALAAGQAGILATAAVAAAAIGLGAYDLLGKRTRWPPLADLVQALGWGSLVLAGSWLAGGPSPLTLALGAYVVVFIVMANGVHGAIRDLPNDTLHGVPTTARWLGAGLAPDGRRRVPRRVLGWAWALQAALLAVAALVVGTGGSPWAVVPAAGAVLLLAAASRAAAANSDSELLSAGMLHLLVALAVPVVAVAAPPTPPALGALIVATYGLPLLTHGWLPGSLRWGIAAAGAGVRRVADLVLLTRPHNSAAAGLAVVVGAHLGGRPDLLSEPVLRAALAASLVVAAANVANDRADVTEDRINRPNRPIAAGRIGRRLAGAFALALGSGAVLLAAGVGTVPAAATLVLALAGVAYSTHLKGRPVAGNLAVAALSASTIAFGALVLGRPTAVAALAVVIVFVSVVASEVLKTTADRDGDRAARRRTIATVLPLRDCLRVHAALVVLLASLVPLASLAGLAPREFLPAGVLGIVVPQLAVAARLRTAAEPDHVRPALPLAKVAWFAGLASLAFLA